MGSTSVSWNRSSFSRSGAGSKCMTPSFRPGTTSQCRMESKFQPQRIMSQFSGNAAITLAAISEKRRFKTASSSAIVTAAVLDAARSQSPLCDTALPKRCQGSNSNSQTTTIQGQALPAIADTQQFLKVSPDGEGFGPIVVTIKTE